MISGSIPLRPPSPIISQRHRSTQFLNADSSTSSPALCFPLPVMSFRSRRVEKEERTDRSLRLVAEGAGHHLFLYLHCLLLGGEGGRRGWRVGTGRSVSVQKCLFVVRLLISILHIHECPAAKAKRRKIEEVILAVCVQPSLIQWAVKD